MVEKYYPKSYTPPVVDTAPVVSASKKTAVLIKLKAHMEADNRGFFLKELINFVQAELLKTHLHVRDDEVAGWIEAMDADWGWHEPVEAIEMEPEVEK